MKVTDKSVTNNSYILEVDKLRTGEGDLFGNAIRRAVSICSAGYSLIAFKLAVDGEYYNSYHASPEGIEEEPANIILTAKNIRLKMKGEEPKIGHIEKLVYDGTNTIITTADLKSESGNLEVDLSTLTTPMVLVSNVSGLQVHIEILYCYNTGFITEDFNQINLSEAGYNYPEYLVLNSRHSSVIKAGYTVDNSGTSEKLQFSLTTTNISAKKLVTQALGYLDSKIINILQNVKE